MIHSQGQSKPRRDTLIQFSICTHEMGRASCFSFSSPAGGLDGFFGPNDAHRYEILEW